MSLLKKITELINKVQNSKGEQMSTKDRILNILNEKEIEEDVKKEIENELDEIEKEEKEKEVENKCKNEKVDKRKLIDEVGGILKGKVDDEIIRTVIGKIEKAAYDESEAGKADNEDTEKDKKETKEIKEDVKEDVENKKCKNSVDNSKPDFYGNLMKIYNSSVSVKDPAADYVSRMDREKAADDYFKA